MLVFNIGFDKPALKQLDTHWTYVPQKDINFYRYGFYNHILDSEKLSMYIEIGFTSDQSIAIPSEFRKTIKGSCEIGIIDESYTNYTYEEIVLNPAYVHISKESETCKNNLFGGNFKIHFEISTIWLEDFSSLYNI